MSGVVERFELKGKAVSCERYGNGHINQTHLVRTDAGFDYILQRINRHVFRDVEGLMRNIDAVTRHLAQRDPDPRHVLHLIPTKDGACYSLDDEGEYWRVYEFITGSVCLERVERDEEFFESAVAFGRFQNLLSDFPAETLHETIPHFHDTPARYRALHAAADADVKDRLRLARAEVDFALAHEGDASSMTDMLARGELPLRVTHNDTKLNNVMLDAVTRKPLCVIDLDTVMPGLVANDFGDSIRFGASTAAEDERELERVHLSVPLFTTYCKGFLRSCGERLTSNEKRTLALGAKLMTLECGVRFLTDYLQGDVYFSIHREAHNLDRCRTQFKLIADMERRWTELEEIVAQTALDVPSSPSSRA